METVSTEDVQLPSDLPAVQSESKATSLADAALQDGERRGEERKGPTRDSKAVSVLRFEAAFLFLGS